MQNQIQTQNSINLTEITGYSQDEISLMKATTAKNTTDLEFAQFASVCKTADLNPFNKEIWCYVVGTGTPKRAVVMFASRDGFRKAAHKNPNFICVNAMEVRKNDKFKISNINGETNIEHSFSGSNTERGVVIGAYAVIKLKSGDKVMEWADFSEYNKGRQMWNTNQSEMIKKVAEAHALKKISNLSGIYAEEEFKIVDGKIVNEAQPISNQDNASKLLNKKKEPEQKKAIEGKIVKSEPEKKEEPKKITMAEGGLLLSAIKQCGSNEDEVFKFYGVENIYEFTEEQALDLSKKLKAKDDAKNKTEIKKIEDQDKKIPIEEMPPATESKAAKTMRESKAKAKQEIAFKSIPGNVCKIVNKLSELHPDILTKEQLILINDCNTGEFKGEDSSDYKGIFTQTQSDTK